MAGITYIHTFILASHKLISWWGTLCVTVFLSQDAQELGRGGGRGVAASASGSLQNGFNFVLKSVI